MLSGHPEGAPGPFGKYAPGDMGIIGPTFTSFAMPFGVGPLGRSSPEGGGSTIGSRVCRDFRRPPSGLAPYVGAPQRARPSGCAAPEAGGGPIAPLPPCP